MEDTRLSTPYQRLQYTNDIHLAYVVSVRDPLNYTLDIYWPENIAAKYSGATSYDYSFISEETPGIKTRKAYSCHMRGVEIVQNQQEEQNNMKEAFVFITKKILASNGWVLVRVYDIDVYRRILVSVYDTVTNKSLNQSLLDDACDQCGIPIAKEYSRPTKTRLSFKPTGPEGYYMVY